MTDVLNLKVLDDTLEFVVPQREGDGYEILRHIDTLYTRRDGYSLEFNVVRWYDNSPCYDLHFWKGAQAGRGLTLSVQDLKELQALFEEEIDLIDRKIEKRNHTDVRVDPHGKYRVLYKLGVVRQSGGETVELNRIQWFNLKPSYDLRRWIDGGSNIAQSDAYRGVTFYEEGMRQLLKSIKAELRRLKSRGSR